MCFPCFKINCEVRADFLLTAATGATFNAPATTWLGNSIWAGGIVTRIARSGAIRMAAQPDDCAGAGKSTANLNCWCGGRMWNRGRFPVFRSAVARSISLRPCLEGLWMSGLRRGKEEVRSRLSNNLHGATTLRLSLKFGTRRAEPMTTSSNWSGDASFQGHERALPADDLLYDWL